MIASQWFYNIIAVDTSLTRTPNPGGRGGTPQIEGVGMLVGNFELNP